MSRLNPWVRLIRFHEYGPIAIVACVLGALLATTDLDFRLVQLLTYCTAGSISAFIINDVADTLEDRVGSSPRNPLVTGELSYKSVLALFTTTSALSITSLIGLNMTAFTLGLTALVLAYQYSIGFRFKDRPPADLLVHGLVPALLVLTSYTTFNSMSFDVLLLSAMVFISSCIAELLQELRDSSVRGSVRYLGIRRSKDLVLVLSLVGIVLYIVLTTSRHRLQPLTIYALLAYFIIKPVVMFRDDALSAEELIRVLRRRVTAVAILVLITYIFLNFLQHPIT
ncbi:MAG: UbiA family prenyltransferase [Sulfolobales archaeon]